MNNITRRNRAIKRNYNPISHHGKQFTQRKEMQRGEKRTNQSAKGNSCSMDLIIPSNESGLLALFFFFKLHGLISQFYLPATLCNLLPKDKQDKFELFNA